MRPGTLMSTVAVRRDHVPSHYAMLGVGPEFTEAQLRKQHRLLSLRYHPDRNSDPSATAKFQEISTAYNVLSTPRKRQVYDAYGEQGLKMYEQYVHMADTDDGGSKIPLQPVTMLLLLCVALSLVILLAAAFGVLLLLYLDGALSSPLAVVLTPLWLIWACGLCCAYALLVSGRANRVYVARLALLLLCRRCRLRRLLPRALPHLVLRRLHRLEGA